MERGEILWKKFLCCVPRIVVLSIILRDRIGKREFLSVWIHGLNSRVTYSSRIGLIVSKAGRNIVLLVLVAP